MDTAPSRIISANTEQCFEVILGLNIIIYFYLFKSSKLLQVEHPFKGVLRDSKNISFI